MFYLIFMIIVHLKNEMMHFSQKQNASLSVFINILVKNTNQTFYISIELLLIFLIYKRV